jgi:hypothetical protein
MFLNLILPQKMGAGIDLEQQLSEDNQAICNERTITLLWHHV